MKEDLLQYIWHQKVLLKHPLQTTSGKQIEVLKTGMKNADSGPDFFDARIRIGNTLWAGNVEVHIKSSDWLRHKHHKDDAYKNVILHVVYEHDQELGIPTLELKPLLPRKLLDAYTTLSESAQQVPCERNLALPDELRLNQFLYRIAVSRLENKCNLLEQQWEEYRNSWEKLFYVTLAKYFGMKVNAAPFVLLAENLPATLLARHKHSPAQIDALILGMAGFLPAAAPASYLTSLNEFFLFFQHKYGLVPVRQSAWKFARTRPANFPTIRLIQFSALVHQSSHLFSKLMLAEDVKEAESLLCVPVSGLLDPTALYPARYAGNQNMSGNFLRHLLINAVIPVKFLYGKHSLNESLCEQALAWLESLEAEKNSIVNFWKRNGITPKHALHSQSLIELHTSYCANHRCLTCAIGNHILYQHV